MNKVAAVWLDRMVKIYHTVLKNITNLFKKTSTLLYIL